MQWERAEVRPLGMCMFLANVLSTAILAPLAYVSVQSEELGGSAVKGSGLASPLVAVAPVALVKNHVLEAFEILVRWELEEMDAEK